jgi:hypothetical protein
MRPSPDEEVAVIVVVAALAVLVLVESVVLALIALDRQTAREGEEG